MKVVCNRIIADIPTCNNRIYGTDVLQNALIEFNSRHRSFGELNYHSSGDLMKISEIKFSNVSHSINTAFLDETTRKIIIDVNILQTPSGNILKKAIEEDNVVPCGIPRAFARLDGSIVEDLHFVTFDISIEPEYL